MKRRPLLERFTEKYVVDQATGCWVWTASHGSHGYGQISNGRAPLLAHRAAYGLFLGPIPDGLTLDHLCRNRSCVNPEHLEAVSLRTNIARGDSPGARVHRSGICASGRHQLRPDGGGCRICWNEWRRGHRANQRKQLTQQQPHPQET